MNQRAKIIREVIDRFLNATNSINYESEAFRTRLTNEIDIELQKLENKRFTDVISRLENDE
jgi:hypothetical protein